ncbi:MAG: transglutaminase-like domain-containing protein [bacterium]|nr:transglutaminase-like domain-containing protein [bacterium]
MNLPEKLLRYISISIVPIIWLILIGLLYYRNSQHSILESEPKISFDTGDVILREEWKRIYLNNEPVGYSKVSLQEGSFANKKVYVLNNETNLYLLVAGMNQDIQFAGTVTLDRDLTLLQFNQELKAGRQRFRVRGIFGNNQLRVWIGSGTNETERRIPLTQRCYAPDVVHLLMLQDKFPLGKKYRIPIFDPTTLSAQVIEAETVGKTTVELNGQKYPAYEIKETVKGVTQTVWVNSKGEVLKEEARLAGLTLLAMKEFEPDKTKLHVVRRSTQDLLFTSSIPANREIANPRQVTELTVRLSDISEEQIAQLDLIPSKEISRNGVILWIQTVDLSKLPPYMQEVNTKEFIQYLAPSMLVQSTDPEIYKTALNIIGNNRDAVRNSIKLTQWVYRNIRKKILVSVPSAVEVLKNREGDCNEHAVLLAALSRSVGIPTKIVAGLVYKDGYFFYHAWNEVWVGQWVPIDATFGQTAVDATHIKLIEGDLDQQIKLLSLVGKINIEIL